MGTKFSLQNYNYHEANCPELSLMVDCCESGQSEQQLLQLQGGWEKQRTALLALIQEVIFCQFDEGFIFIGCN